MSYWTADSKRSGMYNRMTTARNGLTNPGGMDWVRVRYEEEIPDDGSGKLKAGEKWSHWQIYKTGRQGKMWLNRIERPIGGGSPCFTWCMDKEMGLRFGNRRIARETAVECRGFINHVIRKYKGGQDEIIEA